LVQEIDRIYNVTCFKNIILVIELGGKKIKVS